MYDIGFVATVHCSSISLTAPKNPALTYDDSTLSSIDNASSRDNWISAKLVFIIAKLMTNLSATWHIWLVSSVTQTNVFNKFCFCSLGRCDVGGPVFLNVCTASSNVRQLWMANFLSKLRFAWCTKLYNCSWSDNPHVVDQFVQFLNKMWKLRAEPS